MFSSLIAALYLAPSLYMMQVYDRVMTTGGLTTLVFVSLILVAALATLAGLETVRQRLLARASLRLDRQLAPRLVRAGLSPATPPELGAAAPAAGANDPRARQSLRELEVFRAAFSGPAATALLDAPFAPLFILVCALVHPAIGALALGGCALLVAAALLNERAVGASVRAAADAAPRAHAALEADQAGAQAARAMGMTDALAARALAARAALSDDMTRTAFVSAGYAGLIRFVRLGLQSAALGLGAYLAVRGAISPGSVIAGSILAGRAFAPMEQIVQAWRQVGQSRSAYHAVSDALNAAPSDMERTPLPAPRGGVQVEAVTALTPDASRRALNGVSFSLAPGQALGVIGASGAGKTTLAHILAGASDPAAGAVRLDGSDYGDWEIKARGAHIGYLPQNVSLFAGSVAHNIARFAQVEGGDPAGLGRAAVAAAQAAGAHDMIQRLPGGYDFVLGPRGAGLSAGQAQRVGLARALFGGPQLIILDEPNAHLDVDGEAALVTALRAQKARGATLVVVTHRAGLLDVVDQILVLTDGRVAGLGPRDEVLAQLSGASAPNTRVNASEART